MNNTRSIYFAPGSSVELRGLFSGWPEASDLRQAQIIAASSWRSLPRELAAGQTVVCLLEELPFASYHAPEFRDVPPLVGLWLVRGEQAERQATSLRWNWISAEATPEKLAHALGSAPTVVLAKTPAVHPPKTQNIWKRGLQSLGITPPSPGGLTVSIFREFVKPPYGGGNQFMLALKTAFEKQGVRVLVNEVSESVDGYFFDSLWFDQKLLKRLEKLNAPVVVHRIDGPIHLYRGKDKEIDDQIFATNLRLATSTVIQSDFTLEKVFETGYRPVRPTVIRNAASPEIFFARPRSASLAGRKVKIIASSWSDNPNKGGPAYKWLEENLDWNRYEFTFVGRCSEQLVKANVIPPVGSEKLAELLNEQDIYLTASQNDPCSNALIEAMTCGLPAIALRSGGHPELVGQGGLCFDRPDEIPALLDSVVRDYDGFRQKLSPPTMHDVAEHYLRLVKER